MARVTTQPVYCVLDTVIPATHGKGGGRKGERGREVVVADVSQQPRHDCWRCWEIKKDSLYSVFRTSFFIGTQGDSNHFNLWIYGKSSLSSVLRDTSSVVEHVQGQGACVHAWKLGGGGFFFLQHVVYSTCRYYAFNVCIGCWASSLELFTAFLHAYISTLHHTLRLLFLVLCERGSVPSMVPAI